MNSCEFCGNDAHYGYDCPPQVPLVYNQDPCFNQNSDNFPQTSPSFQQQYLFCENYGGPHETFQYDDEDYTTAITPDLPITDCLIMVDKHLDTIPETKSDEFIKSSVDNIVQNPSESEDECECDMPDCDDSQMINFSTFSNPLFDDSTSSNDDEFNLIHNEDLVSTPKNDRFDTKSYLLESLLNRDTLMASSSKIDSILDEFTGELITISPRIVNREHEEYISLIERLLYDNSSPRLSEDFHVIPNTIIESLPTFPIPVEDSDPFMEEIDLFLASDGSIPLGIDGY
nr:hypothetical protein [Tanacetum cinerariifolium]